MTVLATAGNFRALRSALWPTVVALIIAAATRPDHRLLPTTRRPSLSFVMGWSVPEYKQSCRCTVTQASQGKVLLFP